MAWAACWTLLRSRPLQQLGEQGDVGRGPSPCLPFLLFIYRLPTVLPHLSISHLSTAWVLPVHLFFFFYLCLVFALQSEIDLVQLLCGPLLVQAVGLGTCETQLCHETSQALLEALLQACNFVFQLLKLPLPQPRIFSPCTPEPLFRLSSCLTLSLPGSILVLFLIIWLPCMAGVASPGAAPSLDSFSGQSTLVPFL